MLIDYRFVYRLVADLEISPQLRSLIIYGGNAQGDCEKDDSVDVQNGFCSHIHQIRLTGHT